MNAGQLQKRYQILEKRCNFWKKENERLVLRQKLLLGHYSELKKDKRILLDRLKAHKDSYQQAAKNYYSYCYQKEDEGGSILQPPSPQSPESQKKKKKIGGKKKDKIKDKDMPKKPNNPYFQFCQEQRSIVEEEHKTGAFADIGEPSTKVLSKPNLAKILAGKWKQLSDDEKQVYVHRYHIDKERYEVEKVQYSANRVGIPSSLSKEETF